MQGQDLALFTAALGLGDPWRVTSVEFDAERKRLDLRVDFARGARFACPECDAPGLKVHDTDAKSWRHMDFFQHQAYLTARVPRVECPQHKVRLVSGSSLRNSPTSNPVARAYALPRGEEF